MRVIQRFVSPEHRQLKRRPVKLSVFIHQRFGNRLDDEVNVARDPSAVRPKRQIDLLGLCEVLNCCSDPDKDWA